MYDNIGGKIKGLAKATFIVEAIASVITGIALMAADKDFIFIGLPAMVLGPIVAWVSSWLLYGFGEIIDKLCSIERNTGMIMNPAELKKEIKKKQEARKKQEAIAKEENSVYVECPECGAELFFDKELSNAECPYCGCNIEIGKEE